MWAGRGFLRLRKYTVAASFYPHVHVVDVGTPARRLDEVRLEMSFGEREREREEEKKRPRRRPFHHFSASSISPLSRDKQKPTGTSSVGRSDRHSVATATGAQFPPSSRFSCLMT